MFVFHYTPSYLFERRIISPHYCYHLVVGNYSMNLKIHEMNEKNIKLVSYELTCFTAFVLIQLRPK